jgi:hypothetical protein
MNLIPFFSACQFRCPGFRCAPSGLRWLIGIQTKKATPGKRGPAPKTQRQLERVNQLPRSKQQLVMRVLNSMLAQAQAR